MTGIKETQELIAGLSELKKVLVEELSDGFQWQEDIPAVLEKLQSSEKAKAALEGADQILPELKDLDLGEKFSLVISLIKAVV
jgi:hypothetical protein